MNKHFTSSAQTISMRKEEKRVTTVTTIFKVAMTIIVAVGLISPANATGFSDWQQITNRNTTTFSINDENVLRIDNTTEYADAWFEKTFDVKANTAYTFSADVMSDAIFADNEYGLITVANLCTLDEYKMTNYNVTQKGWQSLSLTFNSGTRTQIRLGLRQGDMYCLAKGTTQFTNIRLVEQIISKDNNWNILCLIPKHLDVNVMINGVERNVKVSMNDFDVQTATNMFNRLQASLNSMSNGQMNANVDIKVVEEPLTTLSYSLDFQYWASPYDIYPLALPYLQTQNYDHVFTFARIEAEDADYLIPCGWMGLGGTGYMGIGYSLVRFSNQRDNVWYTGSLFPESALVHEFLHTLERISDEKGIEIPWLHDGEISGYTGDMDNNGNWHKWYTDYMNQNVTKPGTSQKFGLTQESYLLDRYHPSTTILYELLKIDTPTNSNNLVATNPLKAWMQDGVLHVNGLESGKNWSVYSASGTLIYRNTANGESANIPFIKRGLYLIQSGNNIIKIVHSFNRFMRL